MLLDAQSAQLKCYGVSHADIFSPKYLKDEKVIQKQSSEI
jgi:hypothetical protein